MKNVLLVVVIVYFGINTYWAHMTTKEITKLRAEIVEEAFTNIVQRGAIGVLRREATRINKHGTHNLDDLI